MLLVWHWGRRYRDNHAAWCNPVGSAMVIRTSHMTLGESLWTQPSSTSASSSSSSSFRSSFLASFPLKLAYVRRLAWVCNNQMTIGFFFYFLLTFKESDSPFSESIQQANKRSVHTDVDVLAVQTASMRLATRTDSFIFWRAQSYRQVICLTRYLQFCKSPARVLLNVAAPLPTTEAALSSGSQTRNPRPPS